MKMHFFPVWYIKKIYNFFFANVLMLNLYDANFINVCVDCNKLYEL